MPASALGHRDSCPGVSRFMLMPTVICAEGLGARFCGWLVLHVVLCWPQIHDIWTSL